MNLRRWIPEPVKVLLRPIARALPLQPDKHSAELAYWTERGRAEGRSLHNAHYRRVMLALAEEPSDGFLAGKVVADFGCGPRGSLVWAESARERIGIDVLVDQYRARFDLASHPMRYVESSEHSIPLPAASVDVLFTLNSLDHVDHFDVMCQELLRILKPGGELLGSFNLEEPATPCEPQCLTEELLRRQLLDALELRSWRVAAMSGPPESYAHFFDGSPPPVQGERILWVRATKPT